MFAKCPSLFVSQDVMNTAALASQLSGPDSKRVRGQAVRICVTCNDLSTDMFSERVWLTEDGGADRWQRSAAGGTEDDT